MHHYSSLDETQDPDEEPTVLVHVAEPSRARWNHVDDLDSFFCRMYQYHQRHGFFCMLLQDILHLVQFVFIICLAVYVKHGINYPVLFHDVKPPSHNGTKVYLSDVMLSVSVCISNFVLWTWVAVLIGLLVWIFKLIRGVYHMFHFWDIKQFYNTALRIEDSQLGDLAWNEVQTRVRTVQIEQQMCIHKRELSELDIYHRILRQTNYLVAMVNKKLLPAQIHIPIIGDVVHFSSNLKYNLQLLFFWSPWSPFQNPWELREDYKKHGMRQELAAQLSKQILWLTAANLLLAPVIFCYQALYAFFSYAAIIRREPGTLALRRWSLYARLYLRHFNELEHELQARLSRAHRYANKYLSNSTSPIGAIVAETLGFYATSVFGVIMCMVLIDEDVLAVENTMALLAVLGAIIAGLRTMIRDDTNYMDPEEIFAKIMMHIHYLPLPWIGRAHTKEVRKEFAKLFPYSYVGLLETILSPLITPFVLFFYIYPRSLDIVDFFRNFTVNVVGVGDVCSFAQMDVRKHGNPEWHEENVVTEVPNQYSQGEDGKVELSLMHFTHTNPSWKPPTSVQEFVRNVQNQSNIADSLSTRSFLLNRDPIREETHDLERSRQLWRVGGAQLPSTFNRDDVPLYTSEIWRRAGSSLDTVGGLDMSFIPTTDATRTEGASRCCIKDMSLSITYLHSLHSSKTENVPRTTAQETTPLLSNR